MCYYNGIRVSKTEFIRLKEIEKDLRIYDLSTPLIDGFEYGEVSVVKPTIDYTNWDIVKMEWGFIPNNIRNRDGVQRMRLGYKDANGKVIPPFITLNAKGEELLQIDPLTGREKMYRQAALHRRCLMLSTGFYEWRHLPAIGKKGQPLKQTIKYPYNIILKDQELFYIAAIWQSWTDKDSGESVDTCASITTDANELMAEIHNSKKRMPTILTEELAAEWITAGLSEQRISELATYKIGSEAMKVRSIRKDFKTAIDPTEEFTYAELPKIELNKNSPIPPVPISVRASSVQGALF